MRCWDCKENQVVNQTPHRPRTTKKKKKGKPFSFSWLKLDLSPHLKIINLYAVDFYYFSMVIYAVEYIPTLVIIPGVYILQFK